MQLIGNNNIEEQLDYEINEGNFLLSMHHRNSMDVELLSRITNQNRRRSVYLTWIKDNWSIIAFDNYNIFIRINEELLDRGCLKIWYWIELRDKYNLDILRWLRADFNKLWIKHIEGTVILQVEKTLFERKQYQSSLNII